RRRHHRDPQAGGVDHFAVAQRPGHSTQPTAAHRTHGRAGQLDELVDAPGVILMPVADQDQRNLALLNDFGDVLGVVGAGVDDHGLVAATPPQQPSVGALERHQTGVVAQQHRRGLRHRTQKSVRRVLGRRSGHRTSTMTSTSIGASSGNSATPTADRACTPSSPNTSENNSDAPLTTPGCPVNPGADATNPTTLTTRATSSTPTTESTAASALSAQTRANLLPCSGLTSPPTFPLPTSSPSTVGSWPAVYTRLPLRTAGT